MKVLFRRDRRGADRDAPPGDHPDPRPDPALRPDVDRQPAESWPSIKVFPGATPITANTSPEPGDTATLPASVAGPAVSSTPLDIPDPEPSPAQQTPALSAEGSVDAAVPGDVGAIAEGLAKHGGWFGRRKAAKLLAQHGNLALSDAQRKDNDAEAQQRIEARRRRVERLAPVVVYTLAVGFGAGGQVSVVGHELHLDWGALIRLIDPVAFAFAWAAMVAALGAAGLIEGAGLAFATLTTKARLKGHRAVGARIATWLCAFAASGINAWGHWGSPWAYPTALGSLIALALWEQDTLLKTADVLAEHLAQQRRENAVRQLVYQSVKRNQSRKVAKVIVSTVAIQSLDAIVTRTIRPHAVVQYAVAAHVHGPTHRDDRNGEAADTVIADALAADIESAASKSTRRRWPWNRRTDDDARRLTDGSLPDAPVSPAAPQMSHYEASLSSESQAAGESPPRESPAGASRGDSSVGASRTGDSLGGDSPRGASRNDSPRGESGASRISDSQGASPGESPRESLGESRNDSPGGDSPAGAPRPGESPRDSSGEPHGSLAGDSPRGSLADDSAGASPAGPVEGASPAAPTAGSPAGPGRESAPRRLIDKNKLEDLLDQARKFEGTAEQKMAWLWHVTEGGASGRALAAATEGEISSSTGIRRAKEWSKKPPADPRAA